MASREFFSGLVNFNASEFKHPDKMDESFLTHLQAARQKAGIPFKITSDYRDGDDGAHGEGKAVDIACTRSRDRLKIVAALISLGFHRIGIYDKHIHVDSSKKQDSDVMWWGTSK